MRASKKPSSGEGHAAFIGASAGLARRCRPRQGLSIVIPVSSRFGDDAIRAFEETLVSVLENRPDGCEIIVVLGCEYADPWNIREEVEFVRAPSGAGVVACVNVGLASCTGEVLHVLAPGWRATPDWTVEPMARFESSRVGAVVPMVVSDKDRSTVVSQGLACGPGGRRVVVKPPRSREKNESTPTRPAWGPLLHAGFWRADVLELDGRGFSVACGDSHADADLAVAAKVAGYETVVEPHCRIVESAFASPACGAFESGLSAERLFWRSAAARTSSWPLLAHGLEIVRHAVVRAPFGTLPTLAGRSLALLQFGAYQARFRTLRALASAAAKEREETILRIDESHAPLRGPANRRPEPLRRSA